MSSKKSMKVETKKEKKVKSKKNSKSKKKVEKEVVPEIVPEVEKEVIQEVKNEIVQEVEKEVVDNAEPELDTEVVYKKMTFEEVVMNVSINYGKLLRYISKVIKKLNLDNEKHMKYFNQNMNKFLDNSTDYVFHHFVKNFLPVMPEITDNNIDYFLTQKPYILMKSNRRNKKKPNKKATYLCETSLLKHVLRVLREAPKDNSVSDNTEVKEVFTQLIELFDLFHNKTNNHLESLLKYTTHHFSKAHSYNKMVDVINNYSVILEDIVEEEEVSSDDEIDNRSKSVSKKKSYKQSKKSKKKSDNSGGFGFGEGMFDNSSIGKLAKEISEEIDEKDIAHLKDVSNPAELMQKMFSPGGDGSSGFGNIMSKIISKVGTKFKDGSIDQESMSNEASNIMKSFGGMSSLFGGGGDSNPLASMFGGGDKE